MNKNIVMGPTKNKLPKQQKKNHYYETHLKCYNSNNTIDLIWFDYYYYYFIFFGACKKRYPALYDEHIIILASSKNVLLVPTKKTTSFFSTGICHWLTDEIKIKKQKSVAITVVEFWPFWAPWELRDFWFSSLISRFTYSFISAEWKDILIAHKVITNQNPLDIKICQNSQKSQIAFVTDQFSNFNVFQ